MDYLRDLANFIDDLPDYDPFDPAILHLPMLEAQLTTLLYQLRTQIDAFKNARHKMERAQRIASGSFRANGAPNVSSIDGASKSEAGIHDWVAVRRVAPRAKRIASRSSRISSGPDAPSHEIDVPVSQTMTLRCVEIPSIANIRADGVLYYIPNIKRFAIRLAGITIYGNIGIVYDTEPSPRKIHDCEMSDACSSAVCHYYHNPLTCPGSSDIRNFAATSWLYRSGARQGDMERKYDTGRKCDYGNKKNRKLSSRANLDADILTITSRDLAYYNEQLMHDVLCGILMNSYVRRDQTRCDPADL